MAKLKSERHHWWPECISKLWVDDEGFVSQMMPDGKIQRLKPKNVGVIGNGHHIRLGSDATEESPWDETFEPVFNKPDSTFPALIAWLETLERCDPPFEREVTGRLFRQVSSDEQFQTLIECVVSLAVRSPRSRNRAVSLAERFRGPLPERERNSLIGLNIRSAQRDAVREIAGRGKAMVLFSPEREFIYGDGLYDNMPVPVQHWYGPRMLVPLTPSMAVLFARPMQYTPEPRLMTLVLAPTETAALNHAVQIYSRQFLFFRDEQPVLDEAFTQGRHLVFADHRNPVEPLIHAMPGVPPRNTSLDFLFERSRGDRG